jgi:HEAT repeat protein
VLDVIDHDPAGHVRLAAIEVLGRLDANGARATLEPLTQAAEPDIARAAIRALAQAGDDSATAIVERLLRADEPWRRVEAVTALGLRGGRGVASTLQWVAAADADRDVVRAAIAALVALGTRETADAVAATSALVALCAEPSCREACVAALAGFPSRRIADVAKGLQHPSAPVRCAAIEALSRMKRPDASRALERALDDPMPEVRATAINELRRLGSRAAAKKLLTLARSDPDRDVRQAAILAAAQQRADVVADSMPEER